MTTYFSWIDSKEAFNQNNPNESDLDILDLTIFHKEGRVAQAILIVSACEIETDKKWGVLSYHDADKYFPFFIGQLMGAPEWISEYERRLVFSALPEDASEQIKKLTDDLKIDASWDPLFVDQQNQNNPSEVLESRQNLFYFNRVTHSISLSNLFVGKQCHEISNEILKDSLTLKMLDVPLPFVDVDLSVEWTQTAEGDVNIFPIIAGHFSSGMVNTLTPEAFRLSWLGQGSSLRRSGYTLVDSFLKEVDPLETGALNLYPKLTNSFLIQQDGKEKSARLQRHWYKGRLILAWSYQQKRREVVSFRCYNNKPCQSAQIMGKKLTFCLQAIDQGDNPALGKLSNATFFESERGKKAVHHAVQIAKSHLAARSRNIMASFSVPLSVGIYLSPRDSVCLKNSVFSDGESTGKISEVIFNQSFEESVAHVKVLFSEKHEKLKNGENFQVCALSDVEGINDPESLGDLDFVKCVEVLNDGGSQSQFLYEHQYPVQKNVLEFLRKNPTEIIVDLLDLKTKDVLERRYTIEWGNK